MKCVRCRREDATVTIPYNGDRLGNACFAEFLERRVRKTIRAEKMLRFDDTIAVAASGGVSSSTLLYLLKAFSSDKHRSKLYALTVDVGDEKSLDCARRLCKKLSVDHYVVKSKGKDVASLLSAEAGKRGAGKLAFGFNLDDEAEKAVEGFVSGTLTAIYAPKKEGKVRTISPLRECPIEEIMTYARLKKIPFAGKRKRGTDARKIIAKLEENYPGVRFQILSSVDYVRSIL
jgi:tRNA(Ile)-lysidine synthase TilS/MesJ